MGAHVREMARFAASARHGAAGSRRFSRHVGERAAGGRNHTQPGVKRIAVFFSEVLDMELPRLDGLQRPRTPQAQSLSFDGGRGGGSAIGVAGRYGLARPPAVRHLLRLMEGLRLRVKDLDFDHGVVVLR